MFSYLVIFTGVNAAQVFKANPTLGGVIGSVVLLTGMNPEAPITNLFTGDPLAAGQGGIIGVIFAVWLLAKLETVLHRVIPEAIDIIVTPTLCLLAIGLAEIFLIMPLAGVYFRQFGWLNQLGIKCRRRILRFCSRSNLLANGHVWSTSNLDTDPHSNDRSNWQHTVIANLSNGWRWSSRGGISPVDSSAKR